jgi:hypothetical protein
MDDHVRALYERSVPGNIVDVGVDSSKQAGLCGPNASINFHECLLCEYIYEKW